MAITATFRRNLSETTVPHIGVFRGEPVDPATTEARTVVHFWRWDDDEEMTPRFLNTQPVNSTDTIPFANPSNRAVRLYQIAYTESGVPSDTDFGSAEQYVFTPSVELELMDEDDDELLTDDDTGEVLAG